MRNHTNARNTHKYFNFVQTFVEMGGGSRGSKLGAYALNVNTYLAVNLLSTAFKVSKESTSRWFHTLISVASRFMASGRNSRSTKLICINASEWKKDPIVFWKPVHHVSSSFLRSLL